MFTDPQLTAALRTVPTRPLVNCVFGRTIWYRHRHDLLGRKRKIVPQRFNVRDGARVLYLSEDYEVALREVQAIGGAVLSTRVLFPVCVDLKAVVDLREPSVMKQLWTTIAEITFNFRRWQPPPSPTQQLGEACDQLGDIDGLLFPSAIDHSWTNLAVFESALSSLGSSIWVDDPANALMEEIPI